MESIARITGGVDTHLDVHVAAALNDVGGVLGTASFATTAAGYRQLLEWLSSFGQVVLVGVEGTGSYGAGLTRFLHRQGVSVVEVDRPNRQKRRLSGKSDPIDAISAARAALGGTANGAAKTRDGNVEAIRVLRVAKISAHKARTQAINQIHSLVCTAPDELRDKLRGLSTPDLIAACAGLRPGTSGDVTAATKTTLRALARRVHHLDDEIADLEALIRPIVTATAPALLAHSGVGPDTAAALLVAAGDNPSRLRSEATFARLCGAAPIPATSGKTQHRHRLHRGGDRQANSALWRIALTRMSWDPDTKAYVERRTKEGLSKREVMRCLKRYIARELFPDLPQQSCVDSPRSISMTRVTTEQDGAADPTRRTTAPPILLAGPSARRRLFRWGGVGLAISVVGIAWAFLGSRGEQWVSPWMLAAQAALLTTFAWQGFRLMRTMRNENRSGYTTVNAQRDRYWLLNDRTGEPISAPRVRDLPEPTSWTE